MAVAQRALATGPRPARRRRGRAVLEPSRRTQTLRGRAGPLVEVSADVRAAVLLDPAGGLLAASVADAQRARRLAELAHELVLAADCRLRATRPSRSRPRSSGGAVFAVRSARHTLACVVRRLALPALILYDLRQALLEVEAAA